MNDTPKGVVVYFGGLHTQELGWLGLVLKSFLERIGWKFIFLPYPDHDQRQAKEGFTMIRVLVAACLALDSIKRDYPGLPIVLIGNSFGGWLATLLAALHNVDGLVLFNPALNFVSEYLKRVPVEQRHQLWHRFAYEEHFRYEAPKADGTSWKHFIPKSFLQEVGDDGYDVLKFVDSIHCAVFAVTPPPGKEDFLASPALCECFCDAMSARGQYVQHIKNESAVAHGGDAQLSEWTKFPLDGFLERVIRQYET